MIRDSKTQNPVNCNACHPEERSDDKAPEKSIGEAYALPGVLCQGKDLVLTRILRPVGPQNDKLLPMPFTVYVVDLDPTDARTMWFVVFDFHQSRVTGYESQIYLTTSCSGRYP